MTPELIEAVAKLYENGWTDHEISKRLQIGVGTVWRSRKAAGVTPRRSGKRNQSGPANSYWKGDAVTYGGAHTRVCSVRGQPKRCEECGTTTARNFEWANLTGHFHDPDDYRRLCRSCHRRFDNTRRKLARQSASDVLSCLSE
jgi:hypothetical protein